MAAIKMSKQMDRTHKTKQNNNWCNSVVRWWCLLFVEVAVVDFILYIECLLSLYNLDFFLFEKNKNKKWKNTIAQNCMVKIWKSISKVEQSVARLWISSKLANRNMLVIIDFWLQFFSDHFMYGVFFLCMILSFSLLCCVWVFFFSWLAWISTRNYEPKRKEMKNK